MTINPGAAEFPHRQIATQLRDRKVANIERVAPTLIAAGNIGCITQIASGIGVPVIHTVELLDWATGGPRPEGIPCDQTTQAVVSRPRQPA